MTVAIVDAAKRAEGKKHTGWSRTFAGDVERTFLGSDKLLVQQLGRPTKSDHTNAQPTSKPTRPSEREAVALHCFDLRDGSLLWRRDGYRLLTVLSREQCLVLDGSGELATLRADGRARGRRAGIVNPSVVFDDCEHVVLHATGSTHVLDHTLQLHEELRWQAPIQCPRYEYWYSRRRHFWVEGNTLMTFDGHGRTDVFCAMDPAIAATLDLEDPALVDDCLVRKDGDRYALMGGWFARFDTARREVVLVTSLSPILAACVDESGVVRWCRYLSRQCCGDIPQRLPNGSYLAHTGCGAELIWLDARGEIITRMRHQRGRPRLLSDGQVLAEDRDEVYRFRGWLLYDMAGNALPLPAPNLAVRLYAPWCYRIDRTDRGDSITLAVRTQGL